MAFIDIAGISIRFGAYQALRDVSLAIEPREFVTFLGPSGCGKTTTLRILAGFVTPDAGTIHVDGKLLTAPGDSVPPEERRMGMVFQNYAIWPHMSVFENVAFGLRLARTPGAELRQRVDRVLEAVGLAGLGGRHPGQLSGGQQQRVALARSLVVEPSILLLDEPLSNLDAKLREHMRGELKALQRRTGITFIYVTHDQAEAMALSDRIVVFDRGVVQQVGTPRAVYEQPANLFVADFMGLVNKVAGRVLGREGGFARVEVGRHVLAARAPIGLAGPVTLAIRPEAIALGDAPPGANQIDGHVVEAIFLGNILDVLVDIGDAVLRVQAARGQACAPGDAVRLAVAPEDCVAMPDPDPSTPQGGPT